MQKRYCECGQEVLVEYAPESWSARIVPAAKREHGAFERRCARCGKRLAIHQLR